MVTVIIPVFNLTGERYRNFWFIFSRICADGLPIVVAEQCKSFSLLGFPDCIKHIVYKSSSDNIEKSKLINEAVKHADTKYVWINDADVWTKYKGVKEYLFDNEDINALKPFKYFVKLNNDESNNFIQRNKVGIGSLKKEKIGDYGAGSFIVKTDIIKSIPMNEDFVGWGFEDIEWGRKIKDEYKIDIYDCIGVHLYHEQLKNNRSKNEKVYKRMRGEVDIYHTLNIVDFKKGTRLCEEQSKTIESINIASSRCKDKIYLIASCDSREDIKLTDNWKYNKLKRTADRFVDGCNKNFAYIKDLLDYAYDCADGKDDWIMFTNSDCFVSESFYKEILNSVSDVILFHRDDIDGNSKRTFEIGVDGIAIRKSIWGDIRKDFGDYLIGVPGWDTYAWYYFVKNSGYEVSDNLGGLTHNKHEITWDFYNPDSAGQYNKDLLLNYIGSGKATMNPMHFENNGDTAVIMAVWGQDKNRILATRKVLSKMNLQYLNFHLFFVELLFDNEESQYEGYVDGEHIIIRGSDCNRDIFQKEALWNIGAKEAKDFKYYIFCDCDIWSDDAFWFYKIKNKLVHDSNVVVQGVNNSIDTEHDSMSFQSLLAKKLLVSSAKNYNPGLIYGMTREYYNDICGFNPLFLISCGDSGFINEIFMSKNYETFLRSFPFFNKNLRNVKEAQPDVVDVNVFHEHHGRSDTRNYVNMDYSLNAFRKDLVDLIRIGDNDIVEWIDPNCKERKICSEGKNMKKQEDVINIFSKYEYSHLPRRIIFNHVPFCSYNLVEEYLSDYFKVYKIGSDGRDIETGIPYDKINDKETFVLSSNTIFRPNLFTPENKDFYFTFIRNPIALFIADYSFCHNINNDEEKPCDFVENNGNTLDKFKIDYFPKQYVDWFIDKYENNNFAYMQYYFDIDNYHYVGFVEEMYQSIRGLCYHLFIPYKEKNISNEDEIYLVPKTYREDEMKKIFSLQLKKYDKSLKYYRS